MQALAQGFDVSPGMSLWLTDIGEPNTNDLRVVVLEGRHGEPVETEVGLATEVRPDESSCGFELIWTAYVAYAVRNESYFAAEEGEALGGPQLALREDSAFLAYVAATTIAVDSLPGPLAHWRLYTEWHCIDVVSVDAPLVRALNRNEIVGELPRLEDASRVFHR